jgi:hypothetical protein
MKVKKSRILHIGQIKRDITEDKGIKTQEENKQ